MLTTIVFFVALGIILLPVVAIVAKAVLAMSDPDHARHD